MIQCIDKMKWAMGAIHASFAWGCLSINAAKRLTGVRCVIVLALVCWLSYFVELLASVPKKRLLEPGLSS